MSRRLSAILAADVVGYSAMMARDEDATLAAMNRVFRDVFRPRVGAAGGRVVKLTGDGALVEFPSVAAAVTAGQTIQTEIAARGEGADGIRLRIGINLGDVIGQGADIHGEGVNVAARLEAQAEPGGLCISGIVHESLGAQSRAQFVDAGLQTLKNIPRQVRTYRWSPDGASRPAGAAAPQREDRAAIAVLAFDNMSGDADQEYFSDGIAEDIITALSQFREFFVIARNTSFTYKGRAVRLDQVARELGVRYVLEGSVRKSGTRVRVTAQLIDGETGAHLWAGKYDRDLDDVFAMQDEITQAIVAAVAPQTLGAEVARARAKPPGNRSAWDQVLQARWHLARMTWADNDAARALLHQAIAQAPEMSEAQSVLAMVDLFCMLHGWRDAVTAIGEAHAAAQRAVDLDDGNAAACATLGMAGAFARRFDEAERHLERALRLNPNLAAAYGNRAALHGIAREMDAAREQLAMALALSPRDPLRGFWMGGVGIGAFIVGAYEECLDLARRMLAEFPAYATAMRQEAAALAMLGRAEEAAQSTRRLLAAMPDMTVAKARHIVPFRAAADQQAWLEALRRAGLPEG